MKRTIFGLGIIGLAAFSSAGLNFTGVNEYSGELSSNPGGRVDVEIDELSSGLFINSASFGSGNLASSGYLIDTFNTNFRQIDSTGADIGGFRYDWGTELPSGLAYKATGIFDGLFGFYNTPTAPGVYTGTVDIFGGSTSTSSDLLATATVSIEVVNAFGILVSYPQSSFEVTPGQTKTLQHTLQNTSGRSAMLQSRYYSGDGPQGFNVNFSSGYASSLDAGSSQTVNHLDFTGVAPSGPIWRGESGVIFGYYGDDSNFASGGNFTVQAVPEPMSLAILGLGGAFLARRRRKG